MDKPEFLYHYTTVETLKLILESRKIRFSKLTNTDDLEESKTCDFGAAGQYIFVSCWTYSEEESIPLWHMYSKGHTGVRIGLPFVPFKDYIPEMFGYPQNTNPEFTVKKALGTTYRQYLPINFMLNNEYTVLPTFSMATKPEDLKVIYTSDESLLLPKIFTDNGDSVGIDFGLIGKYKRSCWSFQNEIRYRIQAAPFSFKMMYEQGGQGTEQQEGINRLRNQKKLDFEYIDLVIDNDCYNQMEITLGPEVDQCQKDQIMNLVQKYNPVANVKESWLQGKVKFR